MTSTAECACGCGGLIAYTDPSPDFKYYHCNKLWLASVGRADPEAWRAEQRILSLLFRQDLNWAGSNWEFEWADCHILQYSPDGTSITEGLTRLYENYQTQCERYGWTNDLPVLVRA